MGIEDNLSLIEDLDSKLDMRRIKNERYSPSEDGYDPICGGKTYHLTRPIEVPDSEARINTAKHLKKLILISDSNQLRKIARKHYKKNEIKEVRIIMGRSLGYGETRIWAHEKRVPLILGLTGAVMGSLIYYFMK